MCQQPGSLPPWSIQFHKILQEKKILLKHGVMFVDNSESGSCLCDWFPRVHLQVVGMLRFMPLTLTNRACPLLFCLYSVLLSLFCHYGSFNCISFDKFPLRLSILSLCSSRLISALSVLSTIIMSLYECLLQP